MPGVEVLHHAQGLEHRAVRPAGDQRGVRPAGEATGLSQQPVAQRLLTAWGPARGGDPLQLFGCHPCVPDPAGRHRLAGYVRLPWNGDQRAVVAAYHEIALADLLQLAEDVGHQRPPGWAGLTGQDAAYDDTFADSVRTQHQADTRLAGSPGERASTTGGETGDVRHRAAVCGPEGPRLHR